ncbi:MAG: hypothetical protein M4579_006957, partial [Chaenotheca gracillima]
MSLRSKFGELELPATADFHVHLRDGEMMKTVVPTIRRGGVNVAYVMPNLVPPITTVEAALSYKARLQALEPAVTFLMTLYLHPSITPQMIIEAKRAGIAGVKSYPAGVTTNSEFGTTSYEPYYPVFAEMERQDMVLNLHGELPSSPSSSSSDPVTILNAEARFLPTLLDLHTRFPKLRIVLEHCTTADALAAVRACGPTVAATITAHHLILTIDDVAGDPFSFCKPVAKLPTDRLALLQAAVSGDPKFFLGTDSAPHPEETKRGLTTMTPSADQKHAVASANQKPAAGVFTQPYATQLVLAALEEAVSKGVLTEDQVTQQILEDFLGGFGRKFYQLDGVNNGLKERIVLSPDTGETVESLLEGPGDSGQ